VKRTDRYGVARSWKAGCKAKNHSESFWTDGTYLYSYALKIGVRELGYCALYEYTAHGTFVSCTTSCHVGIARPYADLVVLPHIDKYLRKIQPVHLRHDPAMEMAAIAILGLLGKAGAIDECVTCDEATLWDILEKASRHPEFLKLVLSFASEFGADVMYVLDRLLAVKRNLLVAIA